MKFESLLNLVGDQPLFESSVLLAGDVDVADVRRQLGRWVEAGRIHQIRRGLYALALPYSRNRPHPFLVANRLVQGSYVSLQSALAWSGLIPESVPTVTSVSTARPCRADTPLGTFEYRHIQSKRLFGYREIEVVQGQKVLVATAAKALLDLVHLQANGDDDRYLEELRLQNLDVPFVDEIQIIASRIGQPKMLRAAASIRRIAEEEGLGWEVL